MHSSPAHFISSRGFYGLYLNCTWYCGTEDLIVWDPVETRFLILFLVDLLFNIYVHGTRCLRAESSPLYCMQWLPKLLLYVSVSELPSTILYLLKKQHFEQNLLPSLFALIVLIQRLCVFHSGRFTFLSSSKITIVKYYNYDLIVPPILVISHYSKNEYVYHVYDCHLAFSVSGKTSSLASMITTY